MFIIIAIFKPLAYPGLQSPGGEALGAAFVYPELLHQHPTQAWGPALGRASLCLCSQHLPTAFPQTEAPFPSGQFKERKHQIMPNELYFKSEACTQEE
jgi:hypothetical protein